MHPPATRILSLFAFLFLSAAATMGAARFHFLGSLTGKNYNEPLAISADGGVVAGYAHNRAVVGRPFWARRNGRVQEIPVESPGASAASGLSADGSVVIGTMYNAAGRLRSFRWTRDEGTVDLSPNPDLNVVAAGISGDGRVVVGFSSARPFRWTAEAGFEEMEAPGVYAAYPAAVNRDGSVVVGRLHYEEEGPVYACRWLLGGEVELLNLPNEERSYAAGVTPDGSVIVGAVKQAQGSYRAFRWLSHHGLQFLDEGTAIESHAIGISGDGLRIVGMVASETVESATIWTPSDGTRLMNDVFQGALPRGWRIVTARAISANGRWIVGGAFNARTGLRGYILDTGTVLGAELNRSN